MPVTPSDDLLTLTTQIVTAYVSHNAIQPAQLPAIIASVQRALAEACQPAAVPEPVAAPHPAVPIKNSVQPDFIVCLDDGRKLRMLKRHLAELGMTPEQYRAKWGLPSSYPMVAPNYAAQRSTMAKAMGLGQRRAA